MCQILKQKAEDDDKAAHGKAAYVVFMNAHIAKSHTPPSLCVHDHDLHTVCMHMNSYVHFHGENHVDLCVKPIQCADKQSDIQTLARPNCRVCIAGT